MKRSLQSEPSLPLKRRSSSSLFSISTVGDEQQQDAPDDTGIRIASSSRSVDRPLARKEPRNEKKSGKASSSRIIICPSASKQMNTEVEASADDDNDYFIGDSSSSSSSVRSALASMSTSSSTTPLSPTTKPVHIEIRSISSDIDVSCSDSEAEVVEEGEVKVSPTQYQHSVQEIQLHQPQEYNCESKTIDITCNDDTTLRSDCCKTGIVQQDGARHFDRHNRLHKERPARVTSIMQALESSNLLGQCCTLPTTTDTYDDDSDSAMDFLNDEDYLRVHLPGYMQRLDKLAMSTCSCHAKDEEELLLDREACQYKSIYLTKDSVAEAKKAASSLCALVSKVVQGRLDNGFAVIRPPGHHAEPGLAGGYCVINNVAVAAAYARAKLGVKRILIVDWDVHHGNGTQAIFLNDPNVMYFSVHRWQGGNFFPFLQNGGPTTVGIGKGVGFNINVGWSRKGMGDDEYYAVWEHVLLPVAKEYQPELILISAGFDAADGDLGECHVTPECFGELTRALKEANLANGRIVATLEGGYVRSILGTCVVSVVQSLLDKNSNGPSNNTSKTQAMSKEDESDGSALQDTQCKNNQLKKMIQFPLENIDSFAAKNIQSTISAHKAYWKCFGGVGSEVTK